MASRKATASLRGPSASGSYSDPEDNGGHHLGRQQQAQPRARIRPGGGGHKSAEVITGPTSAVATSAAVSNGAILFMFLLVGLFFSLLDCFYIVHYIVSERHAAWEDAKGFWNSQAGRAEIVPFPAGAADSVPAEAESTTKGKHHHGLKKDKDDDDSDGTTSKQERQQPLTPEEKAKLQAIVNDPERSRLVQLLRDAQLDLESIPLETLEQLPKWSEVTALYGTEPVILGLQDSCTNFQRLPDPAEHFVSTAGTFNTGTNLMAELLIQNCQMPARMAKYGPDNHGVRWQVLWGKHTPVFNDTYRLTHRTYEDKDIQARYMFPAVMVRDPYKWMTSMCRHAYGASWRHVDAHCPNLVPNAVDTAEEERRTRKVQLTPTGGIPVDVEYAEFNVHHDTLVGFWNDWYSQYVNVSWPRLLVRFEDLIFYPVEVTKTVCECAGGQLNPNKPFQFIVDSAKHGNKAHGKERTGYIDALVKYGTEAGRYNGYDTADLEYARKYLNPDLMAKFKYKFSPPALAA